MLKYTRTRTLAAALGGTGWAHPYSDPFTCYADGGAGGDGGTGAGDDGGQDGGNDDADDQDAEDGDEDGDRDGADEDALGDKGKKALRELRQENRKLKTQLRQATGGKGERQDAKKDGGQGEDDADTIRERAREEARAEVWQERLEAAAIAAAAGRLANPSRVAQLLGEDLATVEKDDKGRPDKQAISELIDDLLDSDPYLAAPATGDRRRFQGDADSGARKKTKKSAASLDEAIAAKLAGKSGG
ncbi:hypothetical protein ACGFZR_24770 [Streptomyces sp. NPDC048241]|uniref:hypothetical protein n=1 Tax=Streptomyces sp. NPDC048241 TaxID=3365521 RepID=UPI00371FEAA3